MVIPKNERRLDFFKYKDKHFKIFNKKKEELGSIEYLRVGRFMQWAFCPIGNIFITAGCMVEIRDFMRNPENN